MIGLTLGKFAPLHLGYQFLIESALGHVDQLIVVIYACDELPECPLCIRAAWHFALHYHDSALSQLNQLAADCWSRYNLVVLCADDIPL